MKWVQCCRQLVGLVVGQVEDEDGDFALGCEGRAGVAVEDLQSFWRLSGENAIGPTDLRENTSQGIELGRGMGPPIAGMGK